MEDGEMRDGHTSPADEEAERKRIATETQQLNNRRRTVSRFEAAHN